MNEANIALNGGAINQEQYNQLLANAVPSPTDEDDDAFHLQNHHPDMFEHKAIHEQKIAMQQQIAQQIQQDMQRQVNQGQSQVDGRTLVSNAEADRGPGLEPQAGPQAQGMV